MSDLTERLVGFWWLPAVDSVLESLPCLFCRAPVDNDQWKRFCRHLNSWSEKTSLKILNSSKCIFYLVTGRDDFPPFFYHRTWCPAPNFVLNLDRYFFVLVWHVNSPSFPLSFHFDLFALVLNAACLCRYRQLWVSGSDTWLAALI